MDAAPAAPGRDTEQPPSEDEPRFFPSDCSAPPVAVDVLVPLSVAAPVAVDVVEPVPVPVVSVAVLVVVSVTVLVPVVVLVIGGGATPC